MIVIVIRVIVIIVIIVIVIYEDRKGTNGVSTNGVTAKQESVFDRGTLWVLPLTCFCLPQKCQGVPFSPIWQNCVLPFCPVSPFSPFSPECWPHLSATKRAQDERPERSRTNLLYSIIFSSIPFYSILLYSIILYPICPQPRQTRRVLAGSVQPPRGVGSGRC